MDRLLFEIYNDTYNITPKYNLGETELNKKLSAKWEEVQKALGSEFLDSLLSLDGERIDREGFYCYREGFRLGVNLMLEALTSATG